ncbi:glycosyltransferase family 4 protein [Marinilongibacter aquaticus]|uniref:glycosyltransferase family 4 protein n=1 Tax=Marinilongibacter aquaticus TaxID=2975157 RepID=UPI0021BD5071|nr:glycosyltransferase family 4 protein [Marinilongibacter aquaticus]UBM57640.1 glycosyltransferase family 4 protein [Marinilongibacter aquaticus]
MRILIPILDFTKSGGFRVLSYLADGLIEKGHDVTFLCSGLAEPYYPTKAKVIYTPSKYGLKPESLFSKLCCLTMALISARKHEYDLVVANHSFTTIPIVLSSFRAMRFYYIQAYEPDYYRLKKGLFSWILCQASKVSYHLSFFQIVNAEIYVRYKSIRAIGVVPPGVNLEIFNSRGRKEYGEKKIIIGSILRGEESKGSKYIIEAFRELKNKRPEIGWKFAFVDERFLNKIYGAEIVNPHGDESLSEYYKGLDIYISAGVSQFGAIHYPVIENMACGTLVITTPYYPANGSNSIIIEPFSSSKIVEAIEGALKLGRDGVIPLRKMALKEAACFSQERQVDKFEEILLDRMF